MPHLNYEKGLKKLQASVHPNLKLTKDAFDLLSDLCNDLNSMLVEGSKSDFKTSRKNKNEEMTHQNAQNAVKKLMKCRVRDFAISEGQKAVFKYTNQLLLYDEKKALVPEPRDTRRAMRPVRERPPGSEYGHGLQELLTNIHQSASLTTKGKLLLCNLMSNVCEKIAAGAVERAGESATLRPEDISYAVGSLVSPAMYDHAHSEGMRTVNLYEEGWYLFTPRKRRAVAAQAPPQKRKLSLHVISDSWQQTQRTMFNTGIKKLAINIYNECHLENTALKKMNHMLTGVMQKLAVSAINTCIENDSRELHPFALKNAINDVLPETLAFHAQSEGEKVITLYKCGLILFRPKSVKSKGEETLEDKKRPAKRRKKSSRKAEKMASLPKVQDVVKPPKSKKFPLPDFTTGLRKLVGEIHVLGTFNRSAGELINKALLDLSKRLMEASIAKAKGGKELEIKHVQLAVKELFVGQLQEHAIAEGNKAIALAAEKAKKVRAVQESESAAPSPAPSTPSSAPTLPPSEQDTSTVPPESEPPVSDNSEARLDTD